MGSSFFQADPEKKETQSFGSLPFFGGRPNVEISKGIVLRLSAFDKPDVLVAGVIHDQIKNHLHAALLDRP